MKKTTLMLGLSLALCFTTTAFADGGIPIMTRTCDPAVETCTPPPPPPTNRVVTIPDAEKSPVKASFVESSTDLMTGLKNSYLFLQNLFF